MNGSKTFHKCFFSLLNLNIYYILLGEGRNTRIVLKITLLEGELLYIGVGVTFIANLYIFFN